VSAAAALDAPSVADNAAVAAVRFVDFDVRAAPSRAVLRTAQLEATGTPALAFRADLTRGAFHAAPAAIGRTGGGIGALRRGPASFRILRTNAAAFTADGPARADDAASAAVGGVQIGVDAGAGASGLAVATRIRAHGLRADLAGGARVRARAAICRVGRGVDAGAVTELEAIGTGACAARTDLPARADRTAPAAVLRVLFEVHAGATAELLLGGAARVGTFAVDARLARAAHGPALPTVPEAGRRVHALAIALRLTLWTGARAARADLTARARCRAITAVGRVAVQVDARALTLGEPGAARFGADTGAANVTGIARRTTRTAVVRVVAGVHASAIALAQTGIAGAARGTRTNLSRVAGRFAVAAMRHVTPNVDAARGAQQQPVSAAGRTHTELADTASVTAHRAIAAVRGVRTGVDASSSAFHLSRPARCGFPASAGPFARATRALPAGGIACSSSAARGSTCEAG
jgi:hypothetical protein